MKTFKIHLNKFDIRQFLVPLYDCVTNMRNYYSIGRLLKKYRNNKKRKNDFKGFASTYNVEILNFFNPELQLKDTEPAIKNKPKNYCLN